MAAAGITEGMLTLAETMQEAERGRKSIFLNSRQYLTLQSKAGSPLTGAWEESFADSKPQQDRAEQSSGRQQVSLAHGLLPWGHRGALYIFYRKSSELGLPGLKVQNRFLSKDNRLFKVSLGKLGIHVTLEACIPTVLPLVAAIKTGQERAWVPSSKALPVGSVWPVSE